jgi:hypothetical protein
MDPVFCLDIGEIGEEQDSRFRIQDSRLKNREQIRNKELSLLLRKVSPEVCLGHSKGLRRYIEEYHFICEISDTRSDDP